MYGDLLEWRWERKEGNELAQNQKQIPVAILHYMQDGLLASRPRTAFSSWKICSSLGSIALKAFARLYRYSMFLPLGPTEVSMVSAMTSSGAGPSSTIFPILRSIFYNHIGES